MPAKGNRISSSSSGSGIDLTRLTRDTEATRRALYDAVVAVHFKPTPEEVRQAAEDPENHWVPDYGPDEAGLTVEYRYGRWSAVWRSLEVGDDEPEELRWNVLRITLDDTGSLVFLEV